MNNINDLKKFDVPAKGATFQLLSHGRDKKGVAFGPSRLFIPAEDTIFVPASEIKGFKGSESEGQRLVEVNIQFFTSIPREMHNKETDEKYLTGVKGEIIFQNGFIRCDQTQARLYNYLKWHNTNESNPFRIRTKIIIFKELVPSNDIKKANEKRKKMKEALDLVYEMDEAKLREYGASLNMFEEDFEVLQGMVARIAEAEPTSFIDNFRNPDQVLKSLVNEALRVKAIEEVNGDWNRKMPGGTIIPIVKTPKGEKDAKEWFVEWLQKDVSGTDRAIQEWIKEVSGKDSMVAPVPKKK